MKPLHTVAAVGEHFGLTPDQVVRRCAAKRDAWPHLRPDATKSSTWRFTDEDVEEIERRIAHRSKVQAVDSWGRTGRKAS